MRRGRRIAISTAALVIAGAVVAGLASADQRPGATYKGRSAVGPAPIWVVVSTDGSRVLRFLTQGIHGSNCTMAVDLTGGYPITDLHAFSIDVDTDHVTGTFSTENTVEGTLQFGAPPTCSVSSSWSATVTDETAPPPWGGGPPPSPSYCVVPRVVGMRLSRARTEIFRGKCAVGRIRHARSKRPRGKVAYQRPPAGARRAPGTPVFLTVSLGRVRK